MPKFKCIMNEGELSRGCSHAPLRRTHQGASRKQNQLIIQKYVYVPGNIWPIGFQNHYRPVITICHSCIPFLNSSVDYRYPIPIPVGFLAHLPWHVVKKRSKSLWLRGWTLLFALLFLLVFFCLLSGLYITMLPSNCKAFLWKECMPPHHWHELGHLRYLGHQYVSRRANRSVDQGCFISHDVLASGPTLPCGLASSLALFASSRRISYPLWGVDALA